MTQTEQFLTDAFWALLEEKPYKKITVRDIVDRCQVNRNTFYYHFEGIPSLLKQAIYTLEEAVLDDVRSHEDPLLALLPIAEFCASHRLALLNLFQSKAKEDVLFFVDSICRRVAEQYTKKTAERAASFDSFHIQLTEADRIVMTRFHKAVLSGFLLDWMNNGMQYDLTKDIPRIFELLDVFLSHPSQRELTPIPNASGPV